MKRINNVFAIFGMSIIAIVLHGYQFGVSDQEIFIPYIQKIQNNNLYFNDPLLTQPSSYLSAFYYFFGFLSKYFNLELLFLISFILFQFFFFLVIYQLSTHILKDKNLAYLSIIPFILPKFIGGTATSTFDTFLGYRSFGLIFFLYYILFLLKGKYNLAATIAALGIYIHPLAILPNIFLLPILPLVNNKQKLKRILTPLSIFFLISLPFVLLFLTSSRATKDISNLEWMSVIKSRDNYLFLSQWSPSAWFALFLPLTLIFILRKRIDKGTAKNIWIFAIISTSIFLLSSTFLEILKIPQIARFQLIRSISPVMYLGLISTPLLLLDANLLRRMLGLIIFLSLSLNMFHIFLIFFLIYLFLGVKKETKSSYKDIKSCSVIIFTSLLVLVLIKLAISRDYSRDFQFPKAENEWIKAQVWAKNNTGEDTLFLVPPNQTGFRIYSQRSIVGDKKDGAVVIYSNKYALYWDTVMKDLNDFNKLNEISFLNLKKKYTFTYLVTYKNQNLLFQEVYSNNSFKIYRMN